MAQSKATKKFERKHLPGVLERRKATKKIKQKEQLKEKRKERKAKDAGDDADGKPVAKKVAQTESALSAMSVDDFFAGGFEIPQDPKSKSKKRKRTDAQTGEETTKPQSKNQSTSDDSGADSNDDGDDHKAQLEALAKNDPDFYKHLQENDPELLDFDEDADLAALEAISDSDDDTTSRKKKKKSQPADDDDDMDVDGAEDDVQDVKIATVEKWTTALKKQHSLRAAKEVVMAFRAATHLNEEDASKFKYTVSNPDAYHALLICALREIPALLQHHMPVKEKAGGRIHIPTENKKIGPLIRSFISSIQHLLENLSDAATMKITLGAILDTVPYVLSHKKLVREIVKTVVSIWSDSSNTEATRIAAFLVLRRYTVTGDPGIRETVLKSTYQGLVKGSRNTTVHTIQGVNLMKNSAAELWGIDANVGYTTGFTFIRQLAIHLRSSITNRSKEAYKTVYNWQYVHSLDFWSRVLAAFCDPIREAESGKQSPLRPLIYPVVQVTLGALRLIPTSQYFPLRFQLIRSLLRISLASTTYIPLGSPLFEVLNSAEMKKPPKQSTLRALDFSTSIRTPASYLRTRIYQDGVGEQVVELFSEFLVQWTKSIAFPELALPIVVMLKRWLKEMNSKTTGNKNSKVNGMIALLVQKLEANSKWIEEKRSKVEFAPNNRSQVDNFLKEVEWEKTPLGAYVLTQRKQREDKVRLVEQAKKDEEKDRAREKRKQKEAQSQESDGFEDEDSEESDDGEDEDLVDEEGVGSDDEDEDMVDGANGVEDDSE